MKFEKFYQSHLSEYALCTNPLTPAPAAMMAGNLLAVAHQPLELESCLNPLRIREVFSVKKNRAKSD